MSIALRLVACAWLAVAARALPPHTWVAAQAAAANPAWFGVELSAQALPPGIADAAQPSCIALDRVLPGGPADRSGLRSGDRVLAYDGRELSGPPALELESFRAWLAGKRAGERVSLRIARLESRWRATRDGTELADPERIAARAADELAASAAGTQLELAGQRSWTVFEIETALGQRPEMSGEPIGATESLFAVRSSRGADPEELEASSDWLSRSPEALAEREDLLRRLRSLAERGDRSRFPVVPWVQRQPTELACSARMLSADIDQSAVGAGGSARARATLLCAALAPERAVRSTTQDPLAWPQEPVEPGEPLLLNEEAGESRVQPVQPEQWLDALASWLVRLEQLRSRAFASIPSAELEQRRREWSGLGAQLREHIYLHADPDAARYARNLALVRAGEQIDFASIDEAARLLCELAQPKRLARARDALLMSTPALNGSAVLERETPFGTVAIAGLANHRHEKDYAVLLELGGDDVYASGERADGTRPPNQIVVDIGGNDAYEASRDGALAFGLFGFSMIYELAGDDSYLGQDWCQGAALCGLGLLIDEQGDDRYRCQAFGQGLAAWGVAALVDGSGRDRYEGLRFAQGVGFAHGLAWLEDRAGDDEYWCKGRWPSVYGEPGMFEGWGQGVGMGFRGNASGGIGMLLDRRGNDRYEAGNFSQGGGYYYGFGLLHDADGDDTFIGSRYAQGFAAHQALGFFEDDAGDDVHRTRNGVCCGLAWDESIAAFEDRGGNDSYPAGGFSCGAAAHNSIAYFRDRAGRDSYGTNELGVAGANDYHGGTSLALFLDTGGEADLYPAPQRNDSQQQSGSHGLFVDR